MKHILQRTVACALLSGIVAYHALSSPGAVSADPTLNLQLSLEFGPRSCGKDWYQAAIWLEDEQGNYLDTLYVTHAGDPFLMAD